MGYIYRISYTDESGTKHYVGQTADDVNIRWNQHLKCARNLRKYKNGERDDCEQKSKYLYNAMVLHGTEEFKNFDFQIIVDNVPEEKLDELEIHYIKELNALKPTGYNLTTGGGHFRHHEDTKQLMSELATAAAADHIDKYRREETKGLPMYIVFHNKGNTEGFAVCGHKLCDYKSFTISQRGKYKTLDECKEAAKQYLIELEKSGIKFEYKKKRPDLPVGITVFRTGYLAKRKINGVPYKETFEGKDIPDEIKLQKAINFINSLPKSKK